MSHYLGILLWTEVVCAGCSNTIAGEFVRHGRRQMRMVMAELDNQGWINYKGEALCPACQGKLAVVQTDVELPTPFKRVE